MFKFFKNLIKSKDKIEDDMLNKKLIDAIYDIYYDDSLEELILDPVNKLYIINVYYVSFTELIDSVFFNGNDRALSSVNLYSYFKTTYNVDGTTNIKELLKRLIEALKGNKIDNKTESDIVEVIKAYNYLKTNM